MKTRILLILVATYCASIPVFGQTRWPVTNQTTQHTVSGTMGEVRGSGARFHRGVDIANGTDLRVYATEAGTVTLNPSEDYYQAYAQIGNKRYYHIDFLVDHNQQVAEGTLIGNMRTDEPDAGIHVHYQIMTVPYTNALLDNLEPYTDNLPPLINSHAFYRNGLRKTLSATDENDLLLNTNFTINSTSYTLVHNKIDVVANAVDPRHDTNGNDFGSTSRNGPYQLSFSVLTPADAVVVAAQSFIRFNTLTDDNSVTNEVWKRLTTSVGNCNWIITNSTIPIQGRTLPYDRYFNTRLRTGMIDNFANTDALDARYNKEAITGDGIYKFRITARDVDSDGDAGGFTSTNRDAGMLIDNFKPYVERVVVRKNSQSGVMVYDGRWEWSNSDSRLRFYSTLFGSLVTNSETAAIRVTASEPLQSLTINVPGVHGPSFVAMSAVSGSGNKEWEYTTSPISASGLQTIGFQGTDYAGNTLERMNANEIANIAQRNAAGTFINSDAGTDNKHRFNVLPACSGGGGRTMTSCFSVNFSSDKNEVGVGTVIQFTNQSFNANGSVTYSWNFGSGASPATAAGAGPHNVSYSTTGAKTVTLTGTDLDGSVTETKTSFINVSTSAPVVDFSVSQVTGTAPLTVTYSGTSSGSVSSWSWSFPSGSPSSSTSQNPTVTYSTAGSYGATLTVNGSASITKNGLVNVSAAPPMTASIDKCDNYYFTNCLTNYVQNQGIYFSPIVSGGSPFYTYAWTFGDGGTSTSYEPLHSYANTGTYTVNLTVTDLKGVTATASTSVTILTSTATINADFTISDTNVTTGDPAVVFTDASTSNRSLHSATYYWDFGDGAYPRYAYTKGPHSVCYDNIVQQKNVWMRVHNPVSNTTDDSITKNVFVINSNLSQCWDTVEEFVPTAGAASAGIVGNAAFVGQLEGIKNGDLATLNSGCDLGNSSQRSCVFNGPNNCFSDTWFSSHGDVSMRTEHNNSFKLWAAVRFETPSTYLRSSEGIYYQHFENFRPGVTYRFTFMASLSQQDNMRVVDLIRVSLTNGLTPNTSCTGHQLPAYTYSAHELGVFKSAVSSATWRYYEVIFYPPNGTFNQIWLYPEASNNWLNKFSTNQIDEFVLVDDFSLRVGVTEDCAPDKIITSFTSGMTQAGFTLRTEGSVVIPSGQSATYRSGIMLTLKPGFQASAGSTFNARIGECDIGGRRTDPLLANAPIFDESDLFRRDHHENEIPSIENEPNSEELALSESIKAVPNPAGDKVTVHALLPPDTPAEIQMINVLGVIVERRPLQTGNGEVLLEFNVTGYAAGKYVVLIRTAEGTKVTSFLKL